MTEGSSHDPATSTRALPSESELGATSAWWRRVPLWVVWTLALTLLFGAVTLSVVGPVLVEVWAVQTLRGIKGVRFVSDPGPLDWRTAVLHALWNNLITPRGHTLEFSADAPRESLPMVQRLRSVNGLFLWSRHLRDEDVEIVAKLPQLRYVCFSAPMLTADGFRRLGGSAVSTVDFFQMEIPAGALEAVSQLAELRALDIQQSKFDSRDFAALRRHPKIVRLEFQSMDLTGEDLDTIGTLPALMHLRLDRAGVTNEELARLPDTLAVHQITLSGPEITDESLAGLRVDPESVVIRDTGVTLGASTEDWFKSRKRCCGVSIDRLLTPERLKHLNSLGKVRVVAVPP